MIKKIMTDQEALDMLRSLEEYIIQSDPVVVVRTPSEIVFTPDGGIRRGQQVLIWKHGSWLVESLSVPTCTLCVLLPCTRSDLRAGDVAFMANKPEPNFSSLGHYYVILNNTEAVHWDDEEVRIINYTFNHHYKVEIE